MRYQPQYYQGRGFETDFDEESCRVIECGEGSVMEVIYTSHGCEFIQGYCRMAIMDRWGMYCDDMFVRGSDSAFTRFWAEPRIKGLFIFKPTRLEFVSEEPWMRSKRT